MIFGETKCNKTPKKYAIFRNLSHFQMFPHLIIFVRFDT